MKKRSRNFHQKIPYLVFGVVIFSLIVTLGYLISNRAKPTFNSLPSQNGIFQDPQQIDTTIKSISLGRYRYQNTNPIHQTSFRKDPTTNSAIHFANQYMDLSFFTNSVQSFAKANTKVVPTTDGSSITYPSIFPNTDLRYTVEPSRLLEEFIVHNQETALTMTEIVQTLDRKEIDSYQEVDGSIDLYKDQQLVATIPKPVMYEYGDQTKRSYDLNYSIEKINNNTLSITKIINQKGMKWLSSPDRQYPIVIDLVIDNADTAASWVSSDTTNTVVTQETTIKQEGTGSVKVATTAEASTTLDLMEYSPMTATGGTITTSGGYTIHTFNSGGTFTPGGVGEVEALVVGGGGGGGGIIGGGGGGGGVMFSPTRIIGSAMTVTVGTGGTGGDGWDESTQRGAQGANSSFGGLVAIGGGGGSAHGGSDGRTATTGGSGGGGGANLASAEGTPGQGYAGGNGGGAGDNSGGGGGAGEVGQNGVNASYSGDGGDGVQNSSSGSAVYYGGGGGGGTRDGDGTAGAGGNGGGGGGTTTTTIATAGTANTGGGGGGGGYNGASASQMGGNGGTGIVIIRYLTAGGDTEAASYDFATTPNTVTATGGTITNVGGFRIHTFTSGGTFTPNGSMNVETLIVAGGGGGGGIISGGAGGGGVLYATASAVTATGYTITVGGGGTGGVGWNFTPTPGTNGSNSSFNSLTAIGGGGGGGYDQGSPGNGGSGGGGSSVAAYSAGGAGTNGQGYPGGSGTSSNNGGGGGGGGEAGGNAVNTVSSGDGGDGLSYAISGLATFYGGGGGGGTRDTNGTAGAGGLGGGGAGTTTTTVAASGTANTGGGGGGGGYDVNSSSRMGGNGGTGIVIIRYPLEQEMPIGGMVTDVGDYRLHTFKYLSTDVFVPPYDMDVEILVVGGGGGGGETIAGGGGGGGLVANSSFAVTAGTTYPVIVGGGGAGGSGSGYPAGVKGGDSRFSTILSIGGGAGAGYNVSASGTGGSSGGGGGGGGLNAGYTAAQGNDGGNGGGSNAGGGGGGAGAGGANYSGNNGGNGGSGTANSISGSSVTYAGGGGGGVRDSTGGTAGTGGAGGGGAGGRTTVGTDGTDYLGGGGGGGGFVSDLAGGSGGRGIVIVKYLRPAKVFSEATIKTQGSYALKGVAPTTSLSKTLTKTISPTIDLSNLGKIDFSIRSDRTGSNIKIGIHDSGGTTTEITPNINPADAYQSVEWDISGVSNANKDAIDQIIITIVNADSTNTFYIDNIVGGGLSLDDTVTLTRSAQDLSSSPSLTYWVRSDTTGSFAQFEFGESVSSEQTNAFTINSANTWEQKTFNISGITGTDRDAVTKYAFKFTSDTSGAILYFDDIGFNDPPNTPSLDLPTDTDTNQSLLPILKTTSTDNESDYLRYKIDVCENVGMSTNCNTHDQTSSQTGWSGQNAETSTAYTSGTQATYTLQSNLTDNFTYYWRSYAIDPGGTNTWSSTQGTPYSFTTTTAPTTPTTPYAEGATNPSGVIDTTPEFSAVHNDGDGDGADYYQVEVNTQVGFDGTSMWDSTKTSMTTTADGVRSPNISYAGSALSWATTYYWRIKFWDVNEAQGVVSATQNFTMNTVPSTPSLDVPTDTATNQALLPVLKTTGTDADSDYLRYKIDVCENVGMSTNCNTYDQTSSQVGWSGQDAQATSAYASGTQATYTLQSVLATNFTYYWRSYSIDPGGANTWSSTQGTPYSFTTTSTPVQQTDCRVQESDDDSSLTIVWTDTATNEDGYEVQRSEDAASWSVLVTGLAANSISHEDSTITTSHTYRYRVAPYLSGPAYGEWCYTDTFSISRGNFTLENINFE